MVAMEEVLRQFHHLGVKPSFWARAEIKELTNILVPGERLAAVVFGWYENGLALLCCTDQRVLLLDKKPFFLKMEDLRFDKIAEIRFLNRLLDSTVILSYAGQKLEFKSWNQRALRKLMGYVQQAIMVINQQQWNLSEDDNRPNRYESVAPQKLWPASEPQAAGLSYEVYPEELMQQAAIGIGLQRNPYAPTNKFLRRRVPPLGFNQSSR